MHNLMTLWQQRTRRERHLLLGMGVMLIIGLVYYALWQPWQSRETQWRQTLTREQASLQWMRQQTPLLQQLRQQKSPAAPQEPTTYRRRVDRHLGYARCIQRAGDFCRRAPAGLPVVDAGNAPA